MRRSRQPLSSSLYVPTEANICRTCTDLRLCLFQQQPITPLSPSSPSLHIALVHTVFACATSFPPLALVWFPVSSVHPLPTATYGPLYNLSLGHAPVYHAPAYASRTHYVFLISPLLPYIILPNSVRNCGTCVLAGSRIVSRSQYSCAFLVCLRSSSNKYIDFEATRACSVWIYCIAHRRGQASNTITSTPSGYVANTAGMSAFSSSENL